MSLPIIQIEDSFKKGEEKEKEDQDSKPDIEGEDNAIEMSEDFEGKMHDGEQEKKGLILSLRQTYKNYNRSVQWLIISCIDASAEKSAFSQKRVVPFVCEN